MRIGRAVRCPIYETALAAALWSSRHAFSERSQEPKNHDGGSTGGMADDLGRDPVATLAGRAPLSWATTLPPIGSTWQSRREAWGQLPQGLLFGFFASLALAFAFSFLVFCFLPFSLSFLPPLSPIDHLRPVPGAVCSAWEIPRLIGVSLRSAGSARIHLG